MIDTMKTKMILFISSQSTPTAEDGAGGMVQSTASENSQDESASDPEEVSEKPKLSLMKEPCPSK